MHEYTIHLVQFGLLCDICGFCVIFSFLCIHLFINTYTHTNFWIYIRGWSNKFIANERKINETFIPQRSIILSLDGGDKLLIRLTFMFGEWLFHFWNKTKSYVTISGDLIQSTFARCCYWFDCSLVSRYVDDYVTSQKLLRIALIATTTFSCRICPCGRLCCIQSQHIFNRLCANMRSWTFAALSSMITVILRRLALGSKKNRLTTNTIPPVNRYPRFGGFNRGTVCVYTDRQTNKTDFIRTLTFPSTSRCYKLYGKLIIACWTQPNARSRKELINKSWHSSNGKNCTQIAIT